MLKLAVVSAPVSVVSIAKQLNIIPTANCFLIESPVPYVWDRGSGAKG